MQYAVLALSLQPPFSSIVISRRYIPHKNIVSKYATLISNKKKNKAKQFHKM